METQNDFNKPNDYNKDFNKDAGKKDEFAKKDITSTSNDYTGKVADITSKTGSTDWDQDSAGVSSKDAYSSTDASSEAPEESKVLSAINDLGDMIERLGEKIQHAGMKRIGEGIYRLGDKLEHLKQKTGSETGSSTGLKSSKTSEEDTAKYGTR